LSGSIIGLIIGVIGSIIIFTIFSNYKDSLFTQCRTLADNA